MNILKRIKSIGPAAVIAAAFIGPGTVTTATFAGAGYGYTLLWAVLFSVIATAILQEMSARFGLVTGLGIGSGIQKSRLQKGLKIVLSVLILAAILVGNAAYEAGNITGALLGFPMESSVLPFNHMLLLLGILAFGLLYSGSYKLVERILISLVALMGLVFVISAFLAKPDISEILKGLFIPQIPEKSLLIVVGLIGTTVVPYNLFLHASFVRKRWSHPSQMNEAKWDTIISVFIGGIISMCILICAASAFSEGDNLPESAVSLAQQLEPMLGKWSATFIAFGFLAAGLSSTITAPLAASIATTEVLNLGVNMKSVPFRLVWICVLLIGLIISAIGFKPTAVIIFAQFANGLLLPIVVGILLWLINQKSFMGAYRNKPVSNILGGIVWLVCIGLGFKSIATIF